MERLAPRLAGKSVVWFVFYGNDLHENLLPNSLDQYRAPFVRRRHGSAHWEVVTSHVSSEPWPFPNRPEGSMVAELSTPGFLAERAFSACEYLIGRARGACEAVGASLQVWGVPDYRLLSDAGRAILAARARDAEAFDPGLIDRELGRVCRAAGVPFLALSEHLESGDHLEKDSHWSPRGHRRVAALLSDSQRPVSRPMGNAGATVDLPELAGMR